jgi:hypothetical protein
VQAGGMASSAEVGLDSDDGKIKIFLLQPFDEIDVGDTP